MEDIIEEIFLRLPVRPLHRFMSLSKNSASLISSHNFLQKYHKSRMSTTILQDETTVLSNDSKLLMGFLYMIKGFSNICPAEIGFLPLSKGGEFWVKQGFDGSLSCFEPTPTPNCTDSRFTLLGSSNSFLLCKKEEYSEDGRLMERDYYVCNPLTYQQKTLPKLRDMKLNIMFETFVCRGDVYPCLAWVTYKVIIGLHFRDLKLGLEIFSSQTGEWVSLPFSTAVCGAVSLSGIVAPVISESDMLCVYDCQGGGRYFVLNVNKKTEEEMLVINPPETEHGFVAVCGLLCQSQGRIYLTSKVSEVIELWELNEYKWVWDLKYSVRPTEIFSNQFKGIHIFLALDPSNSAVAFIALAGRIAVVDLKEKSCVWTSSAYPDIDERHTWHIYEWPLCLVAYY